MSAKRLVILVVAALGGTACSGEIDGDGDDDDAPTDSDASRSTDGPGPTGETGGLEGTTAEHNRIRAEVGVGPLTWDPQLAAIAQAWVSQCRDTQAPIGLIDHNPDRGDTYPTSVGENVYGAGGQGATGVTATRSWEAESDRRTDRRAGHGLVIVRSMSITPSGP